jgi:hypothetical protein
MGKALITNDRGVPLSDHHPVSARFEWEIGNNVIAYE